MNNIIKRVWNQNRLVNIEDLTGMVFQAEIGGHTFEISGIDDTGAAVELSGTVSGVFRRPDNADIALTGAASGGVVSVTLPADCYAVPGRFGLTIFVNSNSQKVAVYACVGTVAVSSTGNVAGDTPASVEDLIDDINAAIADLNTAIGSIPADYSQFMAAIAPAYSSSALYAVGSYAWHDGTLYRCTTPITTAEAWTAAHWTAAVLGDDVSDLKSALKDSTGNAVISGWVEGKFVSTNGSTYNPNGAVDNADFRYVFVDCVAGDVFTINGVGGGNPRLWAFADNSNNVLSRSTANETGTNLIIKAPENATRLILNDKSKTKNSYYGDLLINVVGKVNEKADQISADLESYSIKTDKRIEKTDGGLYLNPDNFELGNITINSLGWTYSNSGYRVRTKESYDLELEVGDIIRIKDATKAAMYIGYKTSSTTYGATGSWVSELKCDYGGQYAIVIKELPTEKAQASKDCLLGLLEIIKYDCTQKNAVINSSKNPAIMSANHRGMNRNAPENTLPAFKQSKRYGFDYVETDIAWTSDGVPVLLHDATINRTARNADGTEIASTINIADITYEQALEYDFGIWKAEKWEGTKIPTFEQLLTMCKKQGIKVLAEIKSFGYTSERLTALIDMVKSFGAESLVMWISFEDTILASIKNLVDNAPLGFLSATVSETVINKALALKTNSNRVVLMSSVYTEEAIGLCKNAEMPLWAYTINNPTTMNGLPLYLCGVTSDLYSVNVLWYESEK